MTDVITLSVFFDHQQSWGMRSRNHPQIATFAREDWEEPGLSIDAHTNSGRPQFWRLKSIIIHWPGSKSGGDGNFLDRLRAGQRSYVRGSRKYSYGYSWVVDNRTGQSAEVRGFTYRNAANRRVNSSSFSIQIRINMDEALTPQAINEVNRLIAEIKKVTGKKNLEIKGHAEVGATRCPGPAINQAILFGDFGKDPDISTPVKPVGVSAPQMAAMTQPPKTLSVSRTRNSRGQDALWVQRGLKQASIELNDPSMDPGPLDSFFGRRSEAATKSFQRAHGHTADGWVGLQTYRSLRKYSVRFMEAARR